MGTARLLAGIGTVALTVGAISAATAGPANAAVEYDNCPSGSFCFFDGFAGLGAVYEDVHPLYGQDNREILVDLGWSDRASSVANHTGATFCIYSDWRYQGHWLRIPPGREQSLSVVSPAGHNWNNKTSSYKMVTSTENC